MTRCYARPAAARVALVAFAIAALLGIAVTTATAAAAGPPPNDARPNATVLGPLPQRLGGTTIGATTDADEPPSGCATNGPSVWYALSVGTAPPSRIGIKLAANGNLDAVVDVFQRQRSQLNPVGCARTDEHGQTALAFAPASGATYLIRVAQRANSDSATFSLNVLALAAIPHPPGPALRPHGANGVLDGTLATNAVYSMRLAAGTIYKVNLIKPGSGCMQLGIFAPGTTAFDGAPVARLSCAGYRLFTPRVSGRWSFLISADPRNPGTQRYGLHVAPATALETAPGIPLPNLGHVKGFLRGNVISDVRLFRFDVTARSDLVLFLQTASSSPFDLKLLDDRGRYLQCNCGSNGEETIRRQVRPGRYFAVVQAEEFGFGPFTLYRESRLITHARVSINGTGFAQISPGTVMRVATHVTPAVSGPVTVEVDSFDPVQRWQFYRDYHLTAVNGSATLAFFAPHVGRWRATVSFNGTRTAAPATSGFANGLVAGPLVQ